MSEIIRALRGIDRDFDRVGTIVKVIKKYRDRGVLNPAILDEKLNTLTGVAIRNRNELTILIKKLEDEQNNQNNPKG